MFAAASAIRGLYAIFKPGYNDAKAGVGLQDAAVMQGELAVDQPGKDPRYEMRAVDAINQQHGRGAIPWASARITSAKHRMVMRQSLETPNHTITCADLPVARA